MPRLRLGAVLAAAALGIAALSGPGIGTFVLGKLPWHLFSENERQRSERWLRRYRKRLWGRDFDDGDGAVVTRLFEVANRTRDSSLIHRAVHCVQEMPDDAAALAAINRTIADAELHFQKHSRSSLKAVGD
jgi:hypothetical protein